MSSLSGFPQWYTNITAILCFRYYRSNYLAASLLELGLSRGQRVLLVGQTSLRYIVFLMALNRIGSNAILLGSGDLTPDKVRLLKDT